MKKYFIIFLILIVLFPSALAAVQIIAADDADRVIWSEQTIYGDKSELNGVEVDFMLQCMEHLYWNIDLTLGENIASSTDFKFVHTPKQIVTTRRNYFNIGFGFNSFGSSSNNDLLDGDNTFHGQYDMIKDIASRTPAGSKRTENVHLADYYEYYPMYLDFNIGDLHVYNDSYNDYRPTKYSALIDEIISVLEKNFRFRVSENDIQTVTVRKNADGAVVSIDSNPSEKSPRVYLEAMSVVSGNAVYFTVNPVSEDGSEIGFDGEYGLYRIPYGIIEYEDKYSSGNRYSDVRINEISMVYPLDEGTDVVNISTSPDESELYLTLRKESEISLVVFDCATMSVKQNTPIFTSNSSSPVQMVDIEKDYLLYKVDFRTFALIDNHTGEWKTKFTVTDESINTYWSSYEFINHYAYDTVTAYDGERLAILGHASRFNTSNDKSSFTTFYLSIYSEKGNLYTGEFSSTLDTGTHLRYNYIAKPVDGTTPSLVLPEK